MGIQILQRLKLQLGAEDLIAYILHLLFHLSFLPARGRVAHHGFKQVMAGQTGEPFVYIPFFSFENTVHYGFRVVVDHAFGAATKTGKGTVVRLHDHLQLLAVKCNKKQLATMG